MAELTLLPTCPVCNTTWGIPISKFESLVELQSAANAAVYMRGQAARLAVEAKDLRAQLAAAKEALRSEVTAASDFGNTLFRMAQGRETVNPRDIAQLLRAHGRVEQADKLEAGDAR